MKGMEFKVRFLSHLLAMCIDIQGHDKNGSEA